jgi:predicted P-loop ATPase
MSKIGEDLIEGMKNAMEYVEGRKGESRVHVVKVPKNIDVTAIPPVAT